MIFKTYEGKLIQSVLKVKQLVHPIVEFKFSVDVRLVAIVNALCGKEVEFALYRILAHYIGEELANL